MEKTRQFNNNQEYREKQNRTEEILRDKLADLTKEMNQFTYIVSHDLQAPLRMVTGFLELLEKKYGNKLDESGKQYIEFAVKGAVKMKNLVMDLLEYSRLSSDIKPLAQVDLNEIVEEVTKELLPVIEETGAIVTTCDLPVVMARKTQMVQLFHHLLDNALKFRNTGVPEIDLTLKKQNNFWEIAVKDNGEGIDPAFSDKIFIIFRRLNNDEKKYPGTGTGLALCKKIVELHGGTIEINSAVGKGSTFSFTLPAAP